MKAWIFVEGESDKLGLQALWSGWRDRLKRRGVGIAVIPLKNKANYLAKFGERAAEKLAASSEDIVVGLPDLHPIGDFKNTQFRHDDASGLKNLQLASVRRAMIETQRLSSRAISHGINRLFPSLLKHDFEMLLLAAKDELRVVMGTRDGLGDWRVPVEDQDFDHPPKRIVKELFRTKSSRKRAYLETKDAPAVLRRVKDVSLILRTPSGQWTCPEFVDMLEWLGDKLGEPCCTLE